MQFDELNKIFEKIRIEAPEIDVKDQSTTEGSVAISPLLRGYGTTIGNSLRRVLLSSLPGAAAVSISVTGGGEQVVHEFSTVKGVKEDVCQIVLNVKNIIVRLHSDGPVIGHIEVKGPAVVTAGDIVVDSEVEIINPDRYICTVSDGDTFYMELTFDHGVGYAPSERNQEKYKENSKLGVIFVDSIFTPVLNVSYSVENARVGSSMAYDKLAMKIITNGAMAPTEAVIVGAQILREHYQLITSLAGVESTPSMITPGEEAKKKEALDMSIDDLDFTVRSYNCLKRDGIDTVADLVTKTRSEVAKVRNLGVKSLNEIEAKLKSMGLDFKEEEL